MYYFDELILSEIRRNNRVVLQELYRTHFPMVLHLVCSNSGTEQEAKDVYQEAVIAFYERVLRPEFVLTCTVKTYLYAVARRLWLKRLSEKKKVDMRLEEAEHLDGVDESLADIEERERNFQRMKEALEQLGDPCRTILEDFYLRNMSMDEIAKKFNHTNADNSKNQKYKCLQRLKRIFFEK